MTIRVITHRKCGTDKHGQLREAAKQLHQLVTKYGAQSLECRLEIAGPNAGESVLVISFDNWESFGRGMAAVQADPQFATVIGALDGIGPVSSRRINSTVEL